METDGAGSSIELADWRRRVAELYATVRAAEDPAQAWTTFVAQRDALFKEHPQSPLTAEQREEFSGLVYFAYDPALRVYGRLDGSVEPREFSVELEQDGLFRYRRVAAVHFEILGRPARLSLFWVLGYGGGLFLPFRDATSGSETYGSGRYLFDTIKGADLGAAGDQILLDFNFAYNPSCTYNALWSCPLAPPENWLDPAIRAGEKGFV
jgi:uncharacterized protein (DUF1684 family)